MASNTVQANQQRVAVPSPSTGAAALAFFTMIQPAAGGSSPREQSAVRGGLAGRGALIPAIDQNWPQQQNWADREPPASSHRKRKGAALAFSVARPSEGQSPLGSAKAAQSASYPSREISPPDSGPVALVYCRISLKAGALPRCRLSRTSYSPISGRPTESRLSIRTPMRIAEAALLNEKAPAEARAMPIAN